MPWPDVMDLLGYWRHHPPIHILTHGFFWGDAKSGGKVVENATEEELRAAIAGF